MITILQNPDITDRLVFEAKDRGDLLGTLACHIDGDTLYITEITSEQFLIDGLCRTALNFASNRFVNKCVIAPQKSDVWQELLRLDFVQNNNNCINDIDNFFTSHKSCKK